MSRSPNITECISREKWNEFVQKYGTIHHLYEWTYVNRDTFGCPCVNLAYNHRNEILAIYPFIIRGKWPLFWYVSPTDFGGGPIGEPAAVKEIVKEVDRRTRRKWITTNVIRYSNECENFFSDLGYETEVRIDLSIDIDRSEDEIWRSLKDKIRNSIRKSKIQGIEVEEGNSNSDLDVYLSLVRKLSTAVGYRPRSEVFIRALFKYLDTVLLIARWEGKVVGGCVYLCFDGKASCISATRDPDMNRLRIGEALHWAGIQYFAHKKFTWYDFMSRNDNEVQNGVPCISPELSSLHRFKLGWRPEEVLEYDLTRTYSKLGVRVRKSIADLRNSSIRLKNGIRHKMPTCFRG